MLGNLSRVHLPVYLCASVGRGELTRVGGSCQKVVGMMGMGGNVKGCCVLPWDGGNRGKGGTAVVCRNPRECSMLGGRGRTSMSCLSSGGSGSDRRDGRGCCGPSRSFRE